MTTNRRDFTGAVYAADFHGDGSAITNVDRAHIDAGTPSYIVCNAVGTGILSEEAQLLPSQGGLGSTVAWNAQPGGTDGVLVGIKGGDTGIFNAFTVSVAATSNSIVLRDSDGDAYIGNPIATNSLTINPTTATTSVLITSFCTTINAGTSILLDYDATNGAHTNSMTMAGDITLVSTAGLNYGAMHIEFRSLYNSVTNISTPVLPFTRMVSSLDAGIPTVMITALDGGVGLHAGHVHVLVTGQAGFTIKWSGMFRIAQQRPV